MMKSRYENLKIIYNRSKFGWYWAPLFLAFWCLLFYLVVLSSYHRYPQTLTLSDETTTTGDAQNDRFIGERAEQLLLRLTKIGTKVVGSVANEQTTVQFLLHEIERIKSEARTDLYIIEQDLRVESGNFPLWRMVNAYQSIQNVVVRLTPRRSNSSVSLLINSHYDTHTGSPGAGDAGFMVAVMLETLAVLSKSAVPTEHSIVFLFNGAEENPLQGAHAFITKHSWSRNVRAVINLDAAGSGGRELLFQATPNHPWIIKYYSQHIVHPFASTMAEEIFQSDIVPSDTDFRIFRDFGKVPGLDLASTLNGYVYHTKYDRFNVIPRGSYQLTGDNVLALTRAFANAPELDLSMREDSESGHMIFYDVLGWFIVYYSETTGVIINCVVCILAVISILAYIWNMAHQTGMFRRRIFGKFGLLLGIQVASVVLAVLLCLTIAIFLDAIGRSMSWFARPWMIFGLYFCSMFFALGILPALYLSHTKEHGLPLGYAIQLIMHAHCLILIIAAVLLIVLGVRSAYLVMLSIAFYTLSVIVNIVTCFHKKTFLWLIPHILCQLVPFLFYTYCYYATIIGFIPIQGRTGGGTNPDVLVAGVTLIFGLLFAPFLIPLICIFRKARTIITLFGGICLVFIILAMTPIGFPYTEKVAPQRFDVIHTTRTFHGGDPVMSVRRQDSGYYILALDRHPETIVDMLDGNYNSSEENDCQNEVVCGYPLFSARWLRWKANSFWLPATPPRSGGWAQLRILSKERTSETTILFTLEVSGPDHMSIYIQPLENTTLVDWSFTREPIHQNFTSPYFIHFSYALDPRPLKFYLEFNRGSPQWSGPTFDVAVIGHKLHHDILNTDDFREFLAKFPPWTTVTSWSASYESWRL